MLVYVVSLGCPKNFVDTEIMAGTLLKNGHALTFDRSEADLTLINTCAFLPAARAEAYSAIKSAISWKKRKKNRKIAVAGCLTGWDKDQKVRAEFPEVDYWNGVDDVERISSTIEGAATTATGEPSYIYNENTARLQLTLPHVAYLKIADGCNNRCAYCSIPNIRGRLRSRTAASCVAEAKNLLANGVKELVVIAQDVTAFGMDNHSGENLETLLGQLDALEGDFWIRLLYTHPAHYTGSLIESLANSRHVLRYLDIPLQHISDRLLRAMGRKVGGAETLALLSRLRAAMPDVSIRTTFITGLPGETEEEFAELKELVSTFKFHRLGVFEYAPEPGTPAAAMPDQVPNAVARKRAGELMKIQKSISRARNRSLIGTTLTALIDEADATGKNCAGRGFEDAPEIDNCVYIKSRRKLREGDFIKVRITGAGDYELFAEAINPKEDI